MNFASGSAQTSRPAAFQCREIRDRLTGKTLRTYRHASGLQVMNLPRPGFSRRFAAIAVPYGSIHTWFANQNQTWQVPPGTAHFLEHCLFSRDDGGGLLGRMSGLGASANAYTTHDHTLYYFTAVHHDSAALELYLDAIFQPYLEKDRIEAERPIILAELDQYHDDPEARCYMRLMENLYVNHPIRLDIGGTAESVRAIGSGDLQAVWQQFYQPSRLLLTLAGDWDETGILELLDRRLDKFKPADGTSGPAQAAYPLEPAHPGQAASVLRMDVAAPSFLVGIKDPVLLPGQELTGKDLAIRQQAGHLLFEALLSPASPLYDSLYADGLINDSFGFHYDCAENFAFLTCGGESSRPEQAAASVRDRLIRHFASGVDPSLFAIQKRAAAGGFVRSLDSVEQSGLVQAQCSLHGMNLFDYPELYDKIDYATACGMMAFLADPACYSATIMHPLEVTVSHEL
ncbi:MAG TPA: hypothetical protein DD640_08030 [Clostridiales bacterium]|nr:hypothetical protein [Clostridiales bacterium]